jgi:NAD(P)-dependent dehydrogenase (short-subunit alcohol dehydrogenase family)
MLRTTLVTGVSRRRGIGFAIAQRLLREDGPRVFAHSYAPYCRHQGRAAPDHRDAGRRAGRAVNCINPSFVARHMPRGRWNTPAEAADVVALLLSSQAATITGQNSTNLTRKERRRHAYREYYADSSSTGTG